MMFQFAVQKTGPRYRCRKCGADSFTVGDHLFFGRRGPFCPVCFGEWVLEHLDTMEPTP